MSTVAEVKQPIAGVVPPELAEATIMTVWPSLAATGAGRALGRLYAIRLGFPPFTLGHLIALATIPIVVPMYFWKFIAALLGGLPGTVSRYVLTNRRVVIRDGIKPVDQRWVELDRFDTIAVETRPGQAWYRAGDLIFRMGPIETFRLDGVPHPDVFRHICLSAHQAYVGVRKAQNG